MRSSIPLALIGILSGSLPLSGQGVAVTAGPGAGQAEVNRFYNVLYRANGVGTMTWTVNGSLPPGLTPRHPDAGFGPVTSDWELRGVPAQAGTFPFTINVTDSQGKTGSLQHTIVVQKELRILTQSLPPAEQGVPYTVEILWEGGIPPIQPRCFLSTALPGFTCTLQAQKAVISGRPGTESTGFDLIIPGFVNFGVVRVDNTSVAVSLDLQVLRGVYVVDTQLPAGRVGQAYQHQFTAAKGKPPYSFTPAAALPAGLNLSTAGVLSGTPTQEGRFTVRVFVTDGNTTRGGGAAALEINGAALPQGLRITSLSLPESTVGEPYQFRLTAANGAGPVRWTALGLPAGLTVSADGVISGTPTGPPGTFTVKLGATDGQLIDSVDVMLVVKPAANPNPNPNPEPNPNPNPGGDPTQKVVLTTPPPLPRLNLGTFVTLKFEAKDGVPPYKFSAPILTLPPGMTVNGDGTYIGAPTKAGDYQFQVTVTDSRGDTDARTYTQTVLDVPTTTRDAPGGFTGEAYAWRFPGTEAIEVLSKPDWLTYDSAARLFGGIPRQKGTYDVKVRIRVSPFSTVEETWRIRIVTRTVTVAPVEITTVTAPANLVRGQATEYRFEAKGGEGTLMFSQKGTGVPGMTLQPSGVWLGTPTQAGTFPLVVVATDTKGKTAERTYQVMVSAPGQLRSSVQQISINKPFGSPPVTLLVFLDGPGTEPIKLQVMVMPDGGTASPFEAVSEAWTTGILSLKMRSDLTPGERVRGKVIVKGTGVDPLEIPYSVRCQQPVAGSSLESISHISTSRGDGSFGIFPPPNTQPVGTTVVKADSRAPNLLGRGEIISNSLKQWHFRAPFNTKGVPPGAYCFTVRILWSDGKFADQMLNIVVEKDPRELVATGATRDPAGATTFTAEDRPGDGDPPKVRIGKRAERKSERRKRGKVEVIDPPQLDPPTEILWSSVGEGPSRTSLLNFNLTEFQIDLPDVTGDMFKVRNNTNRRIRLRITGPGGQSANVEVGPGETEVKLPDNLRNALKNGDRVTITGEGVKASSSYLTPEVAGLSAAKDPVAGARLADACQRSQLDISFGRPQPLDTIPAGQPSMLRLWIHDNCGIPVTGAVVRVAFSNGDTGLQLLDTDDGRYSGTWTPLRGGQDLVQMTATVFKDRLSAVDSTAITIAENPNLAILDARGIVSGASFEAGRVRAPGEFVSLFGANLAPRVAVASGSPLPTNLAGVSLTFNGKPVPLLSVSPGQINAILPYGLPEYNTIELFHERDGASLGPIPLALGAAQPAVFSRDQSGKGQGIIVDPQFRYYDAANPGQSGGAFVIYCGGLGEVDPPVTAGQAASTTTLHRLKHPVKVTIGGIEVANLVFAGLAPGLAGVYQINGVIPPGVTPGNAVPVTVAVDGQESPPVTMAIR